MNNGAVRCGVSVCRPISGIFTKNPLTQGYHHVATIPSGASNITVTELQNSVNFLGKQKMAKKNTSNEPKLQNSVLSFGSCDFTDHFH